LKTKESVSETKSRKKDKRYFPKRRSNAVQTPFWKKYGGGVQTAFGGRNAVQTPFKRRSNAVRRTKQPQRKKNTSQQVTLIWRPSTPCLRDQKGSKQDHHVKTKGMASL